jgi:hypothetical protein
MKDVLEKYEGQVPEDFYTELAECFKTDEDEQE